MKHLSLLVLFACLSLQLGFSQVRKQFLDDNSTRTTVVIKEDAANDMAILNSQFNLNSIGMGQEIRITTQDNPFKNSKAALPLAELPEDIVTPKGNKILKKASVKNAKGKKIAARAVATMPKTKKKPTEFYYKGIGKSSTNKVKMKKRKLVKRKKIKKRKRQKIRCYRF
ncbi:MAG: hypothetical protein P8Q41_13850 [Saprospiraceae bacterium]|nr:hypothetical protein [Saprospiraceae bacterium]